MREGEETEGVEIREEQSGDSMNWSELFFLLHKHCNLNKWEILDYTLPQITELMKEVNKYIKFEVETKMTPFGIFGSGGGMEKDESNTDYKEITEEDLNILSRMLGG